jgi:hypothetical protein
LKSGRRFWLVDRTPMAEQAELRTQESEVPECKAAQGKQRSTALIEGQR